MSEIPKPTWQPPQPVGHRKYAARLQATRPARKSMLLTRLGVTGKIVKADKEQARAIAAGVGVGAAGGALGATAGGVLHPGFRAAGREGISRAARLKAISPVVAAGSLFGGALGGGVYYGALKEKRRLATRGAMKGRVKKSVIDEAVSKAERRPAGLPGDNRDAEMARSRRTAGLGTAGVGFALATKGKEIAPHVADSITPKWINGPKQAARIASRTKHIASASSKIGGAAVVGGLALAGEGAVSDLRLRRAFSRTRDQAHDKVSEKLSKSVNGVDGELSKWTPGGLISGAGKSISGMGRPVDVAASKMRRRLKPVKAAFEPVKAGISSGVSSIGSSKIGTKIGGLSTPAKLGLTGAGGVGLAGAGMATYNHFGKSAVDDRVSSGILAKAFAQEQYRHTRQDMYSGAAAGGATFAGAGAIAAGVGARRMTRRAHGEAKDAQAGMHEMANPPKAAARAKKPVPVRAPVGTSTGTGPAALPPGPAAATPAPKPAPRVPRVTHAQRSAATLEHMQSAGRFAGKAKKLRRISAGSAIGAAALGAAAYGLHDNDRRRSGRSYGF